ncbi:DUF2568 domain-containing protein [Novosphingobium aerophilum]
MYPETGIGIIFQVYLPLIVIILWGSFAVPNATIHGFDGSVISSEIG